MLLETWRDFEHEQQDEECIKKVAGLMPKRVKKRRKIEQGMNFTKKKKPKNFQKPLHFEFKFLNFVDEDAPGDNAGGWEEFFDYIFPEDEGAKPNLKLLAMAKMWKKQKETTTTETEGM